MDKLQQRIIIRRLASLLVGLGLMWIPGFRNLCVGQEALYGIYVAALTLSPMPNTCVGVETQGALLFLFLIYPCYLALCYFAYGVFGHSLGAYLAVSAIAVLIAMWIGFSHPRYVMTFVLATITFVVLLPQVYFYPSETNEKVGGMTFAVACAFGVHILTTLTIFPWFATTKVKDMMQVQYAFLADSMQTITNLYEGPISFALFPEKQTRVLWLDDEEGEALLKRAQEARDKEVKNSTQIRSMLVPMLMETRWMFQGYGYGLIKEYDLLLDLSRHLRSAIDDFLLKYAHYRATFKDHPALQEKFLKSLQGSASSDPEEEQEAQSQRQGEDDLGVVVISGGDDDDAAVACVAEEQVNANVIPEENWKEALAKCIQRLADLIQQSIRDLNDLTFTEAGKDPVSAAELRATLEAKNSEMTLLWAELEPLASRHIRQDLLKEVQWYQGQRDRANMDTPVKFTKMLTFVATLHKTMLSVQTATYNRPSKHNSGMSWKEFILSFDKKQPDDLTYRSIYEQFISAESIFKSQAFKVALKYSLGTTLLGLIGFLDPSFFGSLDMINALFTFQVIMLRLQLGFILERTFLRLGGIVLGYLYASICWSLTCIGTCGDDIGGGSLYILMVPLILIYLFVGYAQPKYYYMCFATLRTYISLVVPVVAGIQSGDPSKSSSLTGFWYYGAIVVGWNFCGAGAALVLGLVFWPTSAKNEIRNVLGRAYHNFMILHESNLYFRYQNPKDTASVSPTVSNVEFEVSGKLFMEMDPLLASAKLEKSIQRIQYDIDFENYQKAVDAARTMWHCLWKFHHIGGSFVVLRDSQGRPNRNASALTARSLFEMNRVLTTSCSLISFCLLSHSRQSLPVLRPIGASKFLFVEKLNDHLVRCFTDEELVQNLLRQDLHHLINVIMFRDIMLTACESLDNTFTFLETFLRQPTYSKNLREEEALSFHLYDRRSSMEDFSMKTE